MEFERPHRSGTTSSELFICFTSRPSFSLSSSMKISSKVPILSPGQSDKYREQQPTLSFSSSLNRRLGSMKGEHSSPMFKKRGCSGGGYENAEPSSPKVTCIGQVRVKTKKQGKKMMSLGKREGGECRNQKWVHLPLTICEALRGFGAEFSCFLPCGGNGKPCSSKGRGVKRRSMSSCGAAFARWLMALQEGEEEEKRREVRVMQVGEEEKNGESNGGEKKSVEIEEERFSICIPPKNALLLMRCRSEPLRMSALANRFWDSPIEDEDEDSTEEEESEGEDTKLEVECREPENPRKEPWVLAETVEDDHQSLVEEEKPLLNLWVSAQVVEEEEQWGLAELFEEEEENPPLEEEEQWGLAELFEEEENTLLEVEETITSDSTLEEQAVLIEENETHEEETKQAETESEEKQDKESTSSTTAVLPDCLLMMMCEPKLSMEVSKETWVCSTDFIKRPSQNQSIKINNGNEVSTNKDVRNADSGQLIKINNRNEVSANKDVRNAYSGQLIKINNGNEVSANKDVRNADSGQLIKINNGNEVSTNKDIRNADSGQQQNQQSTGMVNMIEQKLMSAVAYEPFVLTRCKSEPLRSSGKLVPESCFWKNARLEPPPGVGF